MTALRVTIIVLLGLMLVACEKQVLYSQLSEAEANEIVARLYTSGLPAEKVAENDGTFRVDTDQSSFASAVALLQSHGLPRERFESLGDVFEKDGFVSSPLEERARLNFALSQEIARTISNIDGVMLARVHLAVPKREHLAKSVASASASVFIKHRASVDLSQSVGKIKSMVVTGFENLPYENVTVSLFPAETPPLPDSQTSMEAMNASFDLRSSSTSLMVAALLLGVLLLIFGGLSLHRSATRQRK